MSIALLLVASSLSGQAAIPQSHYVPRYDPPDITIAAGWRGYQIEIRSGWQSIEPRSARTVYEARLTERGAATPEGVTDTTACPELAELIADVRGLDMPRIDLAEVGDAYGMPPPPPPDGVWSTIEVRARRPGGQSVLIQFRERNGPVSTLAGEAYARLDTCWVRRP